MKAPPFAFRRADSVDEAVALLAEAGDEAKLIAGGQSLVPLLAFRLARPSHLIDISRIADARTMDAASSGLQIGALTRHRDLELASGLDGCHRALREAAGLIGHAPIRNAGTLGGSIAHADPAAELPTALIALDARVVVRSMKGERSVEADAFFTGPFMTHLAPDEMVVRVEVPNVANALSAFEEVAHRAGDFAMVGAAVAIDLDDAGTVADARIALCGVGPRPVRARTAEQALVRQSLDSAVVVEAAAAATYDCNPSADSHASAEYRSELVVVTVRRALQRLATEVQR